MTCATVLTAVQLQVLRQPDAPAIGFLSLSSPTGVQTWSYRQVWAASCGVARVLHRRRAAGGDGSSSSSKKAGAERDRDHGGGAVAAAAPECWANGAEGSVVLLVDEGPLLPMLMFGVLLARMVLVPLEPDEAPARLASVLSEVRPHVVVVKDDEARRRVRAATSDDKEVLNILTMDEIREQTHGQGDEVAARDMEDSRLPLGDADPAQVSHICFTSGSSGRPKGCIATHRSLAAYSAAKIDVFSVDANSRVLLASPPSFDPALGDVVSTWSAGATLALTPKRHLLGSLYRCIVGTRCTHVLTTPSLWSSITPPPASEGTHELRVVALGGEPMSSSILESWGASPHLRLLNVYGVTECAVYNAACQVGGVRGVLDGRQMGCAGGGAFGANELLLVRGDSDEHALSEDEQLQLLPPSSDDVEGELVIAGPQVGEGYLHRPELTQRQFVRLPQRPELGVCFRTGDWVRRSREGELVLLGRRDSQVKLHGKRVDLQEIETAILRALHPIVSQVAVALCGKRLTAFLVLPPGACDAEAEGSEGRHEEEEAVLREMLEELVLESLLARHMRPTRLHLLRAPRAPPPDAPMAENSAGENQEKGTGDGREGGFGLLSGVLPVTRSGKLDRRALVDLGLALAAEGGCGGGSAGGGSAGGGMFRAAAGDAAVLDKYCYGDGEGEAEGVDASGAEQGDGVAVEGGGGWMARVLQVWGEEVPLPEVGRGLSLRWGAASIHFVRLGGDSLAAMRCCKRLSGVNP